MKCLKTICFYGTFIVQILKYLLREKLHSEAFPSVILSFYKNSIETECLSLNRIFIKNEKNLLISILSFKRRTLENWKSVSNKIKIIFHGESTSQL